MLCKLYICIVAGVLQLLLLLLLFWSIWVLDWCNFWYFLSPIKQSFSWNWYIFSIWYGITFLVSCYFIVEYILVNYQIHAYLHIDSQMHSMKPQKIFPNPIRKLSNQNEWMKALEMSYSGSSNYVCDFWFKKFIMLCEIALFESILNISPHPSNYFWAYRQAQLDEIDLPS